MRPVFGLIGLALAGTALPAGLPGLVSLGTVIGGATAALALLLGSCVAVPLIRSRHRRRLQRVAPAPIGELQTIGPRRG
jgi:hypothetical protein